MPALEQPRTREIVGSALKDATDLKGLVSLFAILGYDTSFASELPRSPNKSFELGLSPKTDQSILRTHILTSDFNGQFQTLLFETGNLSIVREVCEKFDSQRSGRFLFVFAKPKNRAYEELIFTNYIRRKQEGKSKLIVRRLRVNPVIPYWTDADTLANIHKSLLAQSNFFAEGEAESVYRIHCDAFEVEKVTTQFYRQFKDVFDETRGSIKGVARENLHDYTMLLLNRLLFLKFLERKGWLNFDRTYLESLFKLRYPLNKRGVRKEKNFYADCLYFLFFHKLNNAPYTSKLPHASSLDELLGTAPFLNGGLFELSSLDLSTLQIPDETFERILSFFSRFNFTVSENTPFDIEVAVDPEMLGKVFENLINDPEEEAKGKNRRKETGSYYTPRNIVEFMCREALKSYLQTSLAARNSGPVRTSAIEKFVEESDASELENPEDVLDALRKVKVLDPACGSGAFLVQMLHELVRLRGALFKSVKQDAATDYDRKLQIIQSNLYGTDIQKFACEIAKLRFWLSLIVDFHYEFRDELDFSKNVYKIPPLPNLTYKIRAGDSLIESIGGVVVPRQLMEGLKRIPNLNSLFKESEQRRGAYISAIGEKKLALEKDIQSIETALHSEIAKRLRGADPSKKSNSIFWETDFPEALTEDNGFDIVISNPPYVRQEALGEIKPQLEETFECYTGTADLYVYFYERGIKLLKPGGTISYISSNKFFRAAYGGKLREFLGQKTTIRVLIDFRDLPVFEATTYPCVLVASRAGQPREGRPGSNGLQAYTIRSTEELEHFDEAFHERAFAMRHTDLTIEGWRLEDRTLLALLEKIRSAGVPLDEYVQGRIYYGIKTGFNKAFVIDEATKNRLIREDKKAADVIKPFLRGRDIKRYVIEDPKLWLLFIPWHFPLHDDPDIAGASKKAEKAFKEQYPAVYNHLLQLKKPLSERNKDETGIRYEWYALQRWAASYWQEFGKPKIVYPNILKRPQFAFDAHGFLTNQKCFIIPVDDKPLLAYLNSKVVGFLFSQLLPKLQNEYYEPGLVYFSKFPVIRFGMKSAAVIQLVEEALSCSEERRGEIEARLDQIVFESFGFSSEEIRIIEAHQ